MVIPLTEETVAISKRQVESGQVRVSSLVSVASGGGLQEGEGHAGGGCPQDR
jgi:predicted NUDIX family phosphoesterase